jgi:hypothetical protein
MKNRTNWGALATTSETLDRTARESTGPPKKMNKRERREAKEAREALNKKEEERLAQQKLEKKRQRQRNRDRRGPRQKRARQRKQEDKEDATRLKREQEEREAVRLAKPDSKYAERNIIPMAAIMNMEKLTCVKQTYNVWGFEGTSPLQITVTTTTTFREIKVRFLNRFLVLN